MEPLSPKGLFLVGVDCRVWCEGVITLRTLNPLGIEPPQLRWRNSVAAFQAHGCEGPSHLSQVDFLPGGHAEEV